MCTDNCLTDLSKRKLLKYSGGIAALSIVGSTPSITYAASLSKEERDNMSPNDVVNSLMDGNKRFLSNKTLNHDYRAQKQSSQYGQYPSAIILSCIDSRAPAEIILDSGIGELFNSRVAGNISNDDILGSMEFACAAAGAKVVFVMGHTKCGAVKGAIANVELGNLTGLLDKIKPAIKKTTFVGHRTSENYNFVDAVAKTNVQLVISDIRENSATLKKLEDEGKIKIVGAMYDISNGKVSLI
ncbi:carbonic anhydrase family protein [Photobacterium kishitanii]|uniref:Carbonic anhydrase n=1 Tax=Photobacterium kishitanii TaxID=318456 RepID=A0A2T3KK89_9GAMM|nr:carbonic anhydrase family protein [Photobacterium kishitanii]PSU99972.1 carbonic anhydrase [Photobacterium kishitanii]PSV09322.1 carbonic anhydrase [Photobacterium kishitanii]